MSEKLRKGTTPKDARRETTNGNLSRLKFIERGYVDKLVTASQNSTYQETSDVFSNTSREQSELEVESPGGISYTLPIDKSDADWQTKLLGRLRDITLSACS